MLLAVLMLLAQANLGMAFAPPQALPANVSICHASGDGSDRPAGGEQSPDCSLCLICHALGAASVLPDLAPGEPVPPSAIPVRLGLMPPPRAPPGRPLLAAAYPTGPPSLA